MENNFILWRACTVYVRRINTLLGALKNIFSKYNIAFVCMSFEYVYIYQILLIT